MPTNVNLPDKSVTVLRSSDWLALLSGATNVQRGVGSILVVLPDTATVLDILGVVAAATPQPQLPPTGS